MKRVVRDVIQVVTTIRWLPETEQILPPAQEPLDLARAAGQPDTERDVASEEIGNGGAPFASCGYCTYIFVYHILDH